MIMNYFKRNKENDNDFNSSYWNGKARIGYDVRQCYNDEQVKKAKKDGFTNQMRGIEVVIKKRKKRDTEESTESNECGDPLFSSP